MNQLQVQAEWSDFNHLTVTQGGNLINERLLQEYGIKGVPTVVFLNADGKECHDLRLLDFMPPDQVLARMSRLQNKCS
jgi:thiol:disulfide interchange protein DsbD